MGLSQQVTEDCTFGFGLSNDHDVGTGPDKDNCHGRTLTLGLETGIDNMTRV